MTADFFSFNLSGFEAWMQANPQWLGMAIFLIAFAECAAIVGLILPGVVMLFIVAVLAGSGSLSLTQTLLLAFAGGLLGDIVSYIIGRNFHQNIHRLPWLRRHPEWLVMAEQNFQRYGTVSLLVGRFIGPLRPMLPLVAGMFDMAFVRFITVSIIAAAGWSVAYLLPGWTTGAALQLPLSGAFWKQAAIIIVGMAGWILLASQVSLHRGRYAIPLVAISSALLLCGISFGWPWLYDLDTGLMTLIQQQRSVALDAVMVMVTRLADFRTQVTVGGLLVLILLCFRYWRHALFVALSMIMTASLSNFLKGLFDRPRPDILLDPLVSSSFPSGHTSAAFAFFFALGILAGRGQPPRMRITWLVLAGFPALCVASSRLYLGAHWPSDVIAGALLASMVCASCLWSLQWKASLSGIKRKTWWVILPLCSLLMLSMASWELSDTITRYQVAPP